MTQLEQIRQPVKSELVHFDTIFKQSMQSNISLLNVIIKFVLKRKGKQMRPLLVFLSAKMFGKINQRTYTAASLIELLHTATLIHDDVIDDSYQRRGFFSVYALWKTKIAVLLGDYLLSKGLLTAVDNEAFDLLKIVSEAVKEISEGELLQLEKARKLDISEEVYFEIIRKKTATLIAACAATGAKSVNAHEHDVEKFKLLGEKLGIAFQIKDDLFDYQKTNIVGKPTGNDIKEKKITLPLIYALNQVNKVRQRKIISKISKSKKKQQYVDDVIAFVKQNGGLEYARKKMNEYKNEVLEIINSYPDSEIKDALLKFIDYTITRKK